MSKQPSTLLLLVHLHILNYPYVNNKEYDHDLFNPRIRGLRARTKAMEDITNFLVKQIQGGSSKTLPMYPCRQPSESLAFRSCLTKYLEQLRHHSIRPPRASCNSPGGVDSSDLNAPWWRDVVVRKSLLEESAGEKFDRLILSLSTHALMKLSQTITQEMMSARLRSEPVSYTNALVKYQSTRQSWTRSALSLLRRQRDLRSLRIKFQNESSLLFSKYEGLSTIRLSTLAHSKYQDLTTSCTEETRPVLASFIELSGVCNPVKLPASTYSSDAQCPLFLSQPLPLPIAAAHHPSYLRKFKHPVLRDLDSDIGDVLPIKSHAGMTLAALTEAEKRVQQVLTVALSHMESRNLELKKVIASNVPPPSSNPVTTFLQPFPSTFDIAYDPIPIKWLLNSTGLGQDFAILELDTEIDPELEKRVSDIRASVLPPFPILSNELSVPRLPNTPTKPFSRLKPKMGVMRPSDHHIPQTQTQSPHAKRPIGGERRKSVRFSTARRLTGRPSIFGAFEDSDNSIDCLINQTHDFPTDDEDTDREGIAFSSPYKNPNARRKTPEVRRIWFPGMPASGVKRKPGKSEAHTLERLFDAKLHEVELPSFGSALSSLDNSAVLDMDNHQSASTTTLHPDKGFWERPSMVEGKEDGDDYANDAPSMTLKELLLIADTGQFEFMAGAEDDGLDNSFLKHELSFSWE